MQQAKIKKYNNIFKNIIGLEEAKKAINFSIIEPIKRPELFPLGWDRGILLYGPPGTGKTLLAAETALHVDAEFIEEDSASLNSKWVGGASQNVSDLFTRAKEAIRVNKSSRPRPSIIFIDEIDGLFSKDNRVYWNVEMKNQFLKEIDGAQDKNSFLHLYLIGATNKPWDQDEGFLRRFQKRIYTSLPNLEDRIELLKLNTKRLELDDSVDIRYISSLMNGYSGSDIKDICRSVHQRTIEEFLINEELIEGYKPALEDNGRRFMIKDGNFIKFEDSNIIKPNPINSDDFLTVIDRRKPSVSPELLEEYEKWTSKYQAI